MPTELFSSPLSIQIRNYVTPLPYNMYADCRAATPWLKVPNYSLSKKNSLCGYTGIL